MLSMTCEQATKRILELSPLEEIFYGNHGYNLGGTVLRRPHRLRRRFRTRPNAARRSRRQDPEELGSQRDREGSPDSLL
jgi:hypothetical protein